MSGSKSHSETSDSALSAQARGEHAIGVVCKINSNIGRADINTLSPLQMHHLLERIQGLVWQHMMRYAHTDEVYTHDNNKQQ